jgi:hypothetical protein
MKNQEEAKELLTKKEKEIRARISKHKRKKQNNYISVDEVFSFAAEAAMEYDPEKDKGGPYHNFAGYVAFIAYKRWIDANRNRTIKATLAAETERLHEKCNALLDHRNPYDGVAWQDSKRFIQEAVEDQFGEDSKEANVVVNYLLPSCEGSGVSQVQFAAQSGIHQAIISQILHSDEVKRIVEHAIWD